MYIQEKVLELFNTLPTSYYYLLIGITNLCEMDYIAKDVMSIEKWNEQLGGQSLTLFGT